MASIKLQGDTSGELTISAPAVAGTNTLTLPASTGTLLTTTGDGSQLTNLPGPGLPDYMHVRDEKAVGVGAGASVSGNTTRTLNTVVTNTITGASLASNQITLPAGTYRFSGHAPSYRSNGSASYLYNITDSSTALKGSAVYSWSTGADNGLSHIIGRVVIAVTTVFEFRQYISAGNTQGLGVQSGSSANGGEIYATLEIFKEA